MRGKSKVRSRLKDKKAHQMPKPIAKPHKTLNRKRSYGLHNLDEINKANRQDAKKLYFMIVREEGSHEEIHSLVRRESLLELIFIAIDQGKRAPHLINAYKSRKAPSALRQKAKTHLRRWLDQNQSLFVRDLDRCATEAQRIMQKAGYTNGYHWIRKEITAYNRDKRLKLADS